MLTCGLAAHFLIGSWYKPSELGKRACIFHASSAAAGMFSGYLQAAVYKGLNGTLGKAGWQWLFIMDGVISAPICLAGFFLIPDLPENTRAFYLSTDDANLARKRMDDVGRAPRRKLGWSILKRIFTRWHVWALTLLYIIFINTGPSSSVQPLPLWLKANKWPVTQIVSSHQIFMCQKSELIPSRTLSQQVKVLCSSWQRSALQFSVTFSAIGLGLCRFQQYAIISLLS
jgi:ACS family pantothenate transporter-like MFS transporter